MQSNNPPTAADVHANARAATGAPNTIRIRPPRAAFPHKKVPGGTGGGKKNARNPMQKITKPPATKPIAASNLA